MGSKLDTFLRKMVLLFFCSRRAAYIVTYNAKTFTSVGLSCKDEVLFIKTIFVFDVVYVKSNTIT